MQQPPYFQRLICSNYKKNRVCFWVCFLSILLGCCFGPCDHHHHPNHLMLEEVLLDIIGLISISINTAGFCMVHVTITTTSYLKLMLGEGGCCLAGLIMGPCDHHHQHHPTNHLRMMANPAQHPQQQMVGRSSFGSVGTPSERSEKPDAADEPEQSSSSDSASPEKGCCIFYMELV